MTDFSRRIVDQLAENGTIRKEDREIYSFGIQQGMAIAVTLLSIVVIGILTEMLWQSILFMVIYFPLRSFSGGYHSSTQLRCYLFSVISMAAILMLLKTIDFSVTVYLVISFASGVVINLTAPVEDRNKPLDSLELMVFRKRARMIYLAEMCILFAAAFLGSDQICAVISTAHVFLAVILLAGMLRNRSDRNKEPDPGQKYKNSKRGLDQKTGSG